MSSRKVTFTLAILAVALLVTLAARFAQAQLLTSVDTPLDIPISYVTANPCTGETITGMGMLHMHMNVQPVGTGGFHITTYFSAKDSNAVSDTGAKYVTTDESFDEEDILGLPYEKTQHEVVHYIRQGESGGVVSPLNPDGQDDFYEHFYIHLTVNANGIPTADHVDYGAECQ